jgi:hypothetical protein
VAGLDRNPQWASGVTPTGHLLAQYRSLIDAFGIPPMAAGRLKPAGDRKRTNKFDDFDDPPDRDGRRA